MDEIFRGEQDKTNPAAFISIDDSKYSITYYVPIHDALKELENLIVPSGPDTEAEKQSTEEEPVLLPEHRELLLSSDITDLSPHALSYIDDNRYRISYYVKLSDYYKEKIEYEEKQEKFLKGDKEVFQEKMDPLLFYSKETSELSAKGLSEADGRKYRMSYYIDLEDYNKKVREYDEQLLKFQAGDKEALEKKMDPLLFYSKETSELSARALSEADSKKYRMSHYIELENYNKKIREYNEKMLKFQGGDKGAFKEKMDPLL
jgi:hypothetical protein